MNTDVRWATALARWGTGFCLAAALCLSTANAQEDDPARNEGPGDDASAADAGDASRETDIAEDNYRRFMELDDRQLERPPFPVAAYVPRSGLAKVDQLPEDSQKHLRNQLRSIILARGPWTPEERDAAYAFVPSEAARRDPALLRQEAEAWAELVDGYHEREAAIHAERGQETPARSEPASADSVAGAAGMATGGTTGEPGQAPGQPGEQPGRQGSGSPASGGAEAGGSGEAGGAAAQAASAADRRRSELNLPEDDPPPPAAPPSDEGVEQSAAAYLRDRGLASESAEAVAQSPGDRQAAGDPGRWGPQAQTLLPPPVEDDEAPVASGATIQSTGSVTSPFRDMESGEPNVLTLEQLRQVRGVGTEPATEREEDSETPETPDDG